MGIRAENNTMESSLVRGTVRESLRLYPVAPFVGRILATDGVIGHYKIPQNVRPPNISYIENKKIVNNFQTLALLSLYSSGRDPSNFSNPTDFIPSRWSRQSPNQQDVLKPQACLPFAIGARSCIGKKIANLQVHIAITKILNNFEIKLNNKQEIHMKLKLVSVPSDKLQIGFKVIK
jgi:ecdysteroid 2-hydroxylase